MQYEAFLETVEQRTGLPREEAELDPDYAGLLA
jgi:hypothetical protein